MKTKKISKIEKQKVTKLTSNELKKIKGGADLKKFAEDIVDNNPPKK